MAMADNDYNGNGGMTIKFFSSFTKAVQLESLFFYHV